MGYTMVQDLKIRRLARQASAELDVALGAGKAKGKAHPFGKDGKDWPGDAGNNPKDTARANKAIEKAISDLNSWGYTNTAELLKTHYYPLEDKVDFESEPDDPDTAMIDIGVNESTIVDAFQEDSSAADESDQYNFVVDILEPFLKGLAGMDGAAVLKYKTQKGTSSKPRR